MIRQRSVDLDVMIEISRLLCHDGDQQVIMLRPRSIDWYDKTKICILGCHDRDQ